MGDRPGGLCIFADINYGGRKVCFLSYGPSNPMLVPELTSRNFNDVTSSFRVGPRTAVMLFMDNDFCQIRADGYSRNQVDLTPDLRSASTWLLNQPELQDALSSLAILNCGVDSSDQGLFSCLQRLGEAVRKYRVAHLHREHC